MSTTPRNIFIGVAWPYVNGDLHVGHLAGYLFPSDMYARFQRLLGNNVLMVSGSDCFGTPITVEADKRGITPRQLIEEYHPRNRSLFELLQLSFDNYTKTDTENHRQVTQDFFVAMLEKDLMIKAKTLQYYSPQENRFLPDRYVEGTCPICGAPGARSDQCDSCGSPIGEGKLVNARSKNTNSPVELKETEHYFVDWPKLQPFLEEYVGTHSHQWRAWIRGETKKWLQEGLQPRAITRDLEWGVEIPVDRIPKDKLIDHHERKRIYVWFDAVIGYLSASFEWAAAKPGRSWEQFWKDPESHHVYFMGKDNLVFHTIFWPGQLHAYDDTLHLPDNNSINQFLTLDGEKFSKSRGVTIDSREIVEKYGLDAVRFYIASINPENSDASFIWDEFITKTNALLIGNIGNFIARSTKLSEHQDFSKITAVEEEIVAATVDHMNRARTALDGCGLREYIDIILSLSAFGNKYITVKAPWGIKDRTAPAFTETMANCIYIINALSILLTPILPEAMDRVRKTLGTPATLWPKDIRSELLALLQGVKITEAKPLFAKLEKRA